MTPQNARSTFNKCLLNILSLYHKKERLKKETSSTLITNQNQFINPQGFHPPFQFHQLEHNQGARPC
jgi:hypothetical protein